MASQCAFELERFCLRRSLTRNGDHGVEILDLPDLCGVVGATSREVLDVGGEQDAGYVFVVSFEVGDGHELGLFAVLDEMPDVDVALYSVSGSSG
jgi:hypothetical protein